MNAEKRGILLGRLTKEKNRTKTALSTDGQVDPRLFQADHVDFERSVVTNGDRLARFGRPDRFLQGRIDAISTFGNAPINDLGTRTSLNGFAFFKLGELSFVGLAPGTHLDADQLQTSSMAQLRRLLIDLERLARLALLQGRKGIGIDPGSRRRRQGSIFFHPIRLTKLTPFRECAFRIARRQQEDGEIVVVVADPNVVEIAGQIPSLLNESGPRSS